MEDYYSFMGFLVAKKLAFLLVVIIGVLSLTYIAKTVSFDDLFGGSEETSNMPVYKYSDPSLQGYSGSANILARHKESVYLGSIEDGKASGEGTLYNRDGQLVYSGAFKSTLRINRRNRKRKRRIENKARGKLLCKPLQNRKVTLERFKC